MACERIRSRSRHCVRGDREQHLVPGFCVWVRQSALRKTPLLPQPKLIKPAETPVAIPPIVDVARDPGPGAITVTMQQTGNVAPQPLVPDRAPIAAARTTPPYPIVARRMGWEGTVMLRLTVSSQGKVARADVVTSSGHDELDRAAQVLTRVLFNLGVQ